jgi:hypothetical protein
MGIQLHFLGTSSGLPTKIRRNQTIVLEIDSTKGRQHYLIDPADGASSFLAADLGHEHLAGVFISHMHIDHFSGLFQVMKTAWHLGRTSPLPIYLPEEGIPLIRSVMEQSYLWPEMIYPVEFHSLQSSCNQLLNVDKQLSILPTPNEHLMVYKRRSDKRNWNYGTQASFESYCLEFVHHHAEDYRWGYVGNLGREQEVQRFTKCSTVVTELAHLDPAILCLEFKALGTEKVIVTHYGLKWEQRTDEIRRIGEEIGCRMLPVDDGEVVQLYPPDDP